MHRLGPKMALAGTPSKLHVTILQLVHICIIKNGTKINFTKHTYV